MASAVGRVVLAVSSLSLVRKLVTGTKPGRRLSGRFVAGETLDQAIEVARDLNAVGATVSLDHLGEHVVDVSQARAARDGYLAALDRIAAEDVDGNISVKLTQLGLGSDDDLAFESLSALAERADRYGRTVTIDMEESAYTEATITMFEKAQAEHGNLGVALQAYLRRSSVDLDRIIAAGGHVRICKGAYAEGSDVAFTSKIAVDRSFDDLTRMAMEHNALYPAIASHDDDRIDFAIAEAEWRREPWEFQLLYGVRTKKQAELLAAGHPVRVYVPYGAAWYPYLTRRLAERPANLLFFLRAVFGK